MKYIFGAAFDPITKAHLNIIKAISKHLADNDEFYVLISNNDEKQYNTTLDERFEVVNATIRSYLNEHVPTVIEQRTRSWVFLRENFAGQEDEIIMVVGEDEWESLLDKKWHQSDELLEKYKFLVVCRDSENARKVRDFDKAYKIIKISETDEVSSSKVREIFFRNPMTKYSEVKDYILKKTFEVIKENGLYNQNGESYADEEAEFIKNYQVEKVKKGYAEPSVTADILAYNGNKILLIRRKNFPYRGFWCLPGGFFDKTDADINYTAAREFREETTIDISPDKFEQIKTYAHQFDPRLRIVDVAFSVRVNAKDMKKAVGSDDAADAKWFDIDNLPALGFHHAQIINDWANKTDRWDG